MRKNRAKGDAKHVRIYNGMMTSPAWRSLSGSAFKLLVYVASFEGPANPNGSLYCSALQGAQGIGVSKVTALKAFQELQDKGFIRATQKGHFHVKGGPATCWRLTWLAWPGVKGATKEYEKWKPDENKTRVKKLNGTGIESIPPDRTQASAGKQSIPTVGASPQNYVEPIGKETIPHSIAIGDAAFSAGIQPQPCAGNDGAIATGERSRDSESSASIGWWQPDGIGPLMAGLATLNALHLHHAQRGLAA